MFQEGFAVECAVQAEGVFVLSVAGFCVVVRFEQVVGVFLDRGRSVTRVTVPLVGLAAFRFRFFAWGFHAAWVARL